MRHLLLQRKKDVDTDSTRRFHTRSSVGRGNGKSNHHPMSSEDAVFTSMGIHWRVCGALLRRGEVYLYRKKVILVVDDEDMALQTVVALLENIRGYNVIGANSLDAAVRHLAEQDSVDILISDYRLWRARSGLELCEIALFLNADIAIVLISTEPAHEMEVRPLRSIYLQKPFRRFDLLHAMKAAKSKAREVNTKAAGT